MQQHRHHRIPERDSAELRAYAPTVADAVQLAPQRTVHSAVREFSDGLEGVRPTNATIGIASRIAEAALDKTVEPEITVDVDGALAFDLRLANGLLLLAELDLDGALDASVYDDRKGVLVERLPHATESDVIGWFLKGHRAGS